MRIRDFHFLAGWLAAFFFIFRLLLLAFQPQLRYTRLLHSQAPNSQVASRVVRELKSQHIALTKKQQREEKKSMMMVRGKLHEISRYFFCAYFFWKTWTRRRIRPRMSFLSLKQFCRQWNSNTGDYASLQLCSSSHPSVVIPILAEATKKKREEAEKQKKRRGKKLKFESYT